MLLREVKFAESSREEDGGSVSQVMVSLPALSFVRGWSHGGSRQEEAAQSVARPVAFQLLVDFRLRGW